jgi:subtilase family serine protease
MLPFLCALTLTVSAQTTRNLPPARALITQPIDETRLVTLAGNTRSEANSQNDKGKLPDSFALDHIFLQLKRSPEREEAFKSYIDQQHDSKSPNFHKWLTAEEVGKLYGPSPKDAETVSQWVRSNGFTVNSLSPSGLVLDLSGTAGTVSSAFHTEMHKLSVDGKEHIANMSDPRIPEALAPAITGITSLHDFKPHNMVRPRAKYTIGSGANSEQLVVPADLATIYDLKAAFAAGITGKGQTIAVVEDTDLYTTTDWDTFRSTLGLSSYTSGSLVTTQPGGCADPGDNTDDVEAILDAEWATASAPDATIEVASCNATQTSDGVLIAAQNLINGANPPQIMSVSYGYCEAGNGAGYNASLNSLFQQAVSEGVSVFVAAGDENAAECDGGAAAATHGIGVSSEASTPYNVAVGGTDFGDTYQSTVNTYWGTKNSATYGSAISYIPEIPWNGSCASSITAGFYGYSVGYGTSGFCGSYEASEYGYIGVMGGGGGPSGCATGAPAENLIVGGSCQGYAKPSWQTGVTGIPNDGVRDLPDVAMFASNGVWFHAYVFCYSNTSNNGNGGAACTGEPVNWSAAGGTSFASPVMAGIQALVNQKMGGKQGNPNPVYYKLAASSAASSVFHSITSGDIDVNCSGDIDCYGTAFVGRGRAATETAFTDGNGALSTSGTTFTSAYKATSGYNLATGLGSVDGYNLVLNWSKGQ